MLNQKNQLSFGSNAGTVALQCKCGFRLLGVCIVESAVVEVLNTLLEVKSLHQAMPEEEALYSVKLNARQVLCMRCKEFCVFVEEVTRIEAAYKCPKCKQLYMAPWRDWRGHG